MHDYTTRQINTPEGRWVLWSLERAGGPTPCAAADPPRGGQSAYDGDIARGITQPL